MLFWTDLVSVLAIEIHLYNKCNVHKTVVNLNLTSL